MDGKQRGQFAMDVHAMSDKEMVHIISIIAMECLNRGYDKPETEIHNQAYKFLTVAMVKLDPL